MTVSSETTYTGPLIANGVATAFPWTFLAMAADEISVFGLDAVGATVSLPAFTAALAGTAPSAGTVTFNTAPADGTRVWIASDPEFLQEIGFEDGSRWLAGPVNEANDRAALRTLAVKRDADRAVKLPIGDPGVTLPAGSGPTLYTSVNTLAAIAEDISNVSENVPDINTVADDLTGADTIGTVATNIVAVGTVATNIAAILAVDANATNINTVSGIDAAVTTVSGIAAAVSTAAGISVSISTVAGISANVTTVAGISANVTTVAGIAADVTAVSGALTAINAVNAALASIGTVATNIANVNAVGGSIANVDAVAGALTDIATVVTNITTINTIAAASDGLQMLTGVDALPGEPEVAYAYSNGTRWLYANPRKIAHPMLDGIPNMPGFRAKAPGFAEHAYLHADGTAWASIRPGLGGWRHPDSDDYRRRIYALEIASMKDPQWADLFPSTDYVLFPATGQSLITGHESTGATTTSAFSTNFPPTLGLMFNGGVRPTDLSTNMATQMASFVQLAESYIATAADPTTSNGTNDGETPLAGAMEMIEQLLSEENGADLSTYNQRLVTYCAGRGATGVADLIPTPDTYGRHALLKTGITNAKTVAVAATKSINLGALIVEQGGADTASMSATTWASHWRTIRTDAETHAQTQMGNTRPLPLIFGQTNTHPLTGGTPDIGYKQVEMALTEDYFACVPDHMVQRQSSAHYTGLGGYWMGGFYGWMLKRWLWDGVKVLPLIPVWERHGDQIVATFPYLDPGRKMQVDTTWITAQPNWGVTLTDGAGVAKTISGGRFVGNSLVFDCASTPAAGWKVQTGYQSASGPMASKVGLCNLCDDTPLIMNKVGLPIRRYVPLYEGTLA